MSYKVTDKLVIVPNVDGVSGDGYFYKDAVISAGWNDERCDQLVKDGQIEKTEAAVAAEGVDPNEPPAKSASKGEWVAFATSEDRGDDRLSEEDASAATKDELVEKFSA